MQKLETIPLFRIAQAAVLAEPTAAAADSATIDGDLTDYIGHTITADEWIALQAECKNRHGNDWTFYADLIGNEYLVRRLTAKPE